MSRKQRSLIAQLRTGILPLRIESGRFNNIKDPITGKLRKLRADERLCQFCNSGNIEDEIHFICTCSVYNDIREKMFMECSEKVPEFRQFSTKEKFIHIMTKDIKILSHHILDMWNTRNKLMYK